MEREVVVGNKALEELRERLLRWDAHCAQLKELYYRYLDLAAFRSEKCYFPGRRCRRSWKREYDVGDLALMWTYIANTAPLCGKLIRALAEVEYKIRRRAVESLEKYGGVEKRTNPSGKREIVHVLLKRPVHVHLVVLGDRLYAIWGEFDGLSKNGQARAVEIEQRALDVIEQYKHGEKVNEYEVDREYERLWLEVPLSEGASKLLGGRDKAPVALFRNLGWLLSDDVRIELRHSSSNPGQVAMRLFDWIAIAMYAKRGLGSDPLVFKLSVYQVGKTKDGINPLIEMWPIGTAAEVIKTIYEQFEITLGEPQQVIARGYAVLKALREEAFKRDGKVYVVDDVVAWIAFSATTITLVLGDGYISAFELGVATKPSPRTTLKGETTNDRKLAKALGGTATRKGVHLKSWHMRLALPVPPTPTFEKVTRVYDAFVNNVTTFFCALDFSPLFYYTRVISAPLLPFTLLMSKRRRCRQRRKIYCPTRRLSGA